MDQMVKHSPPPPWPAGPGRSAACDSQETLAARILSPTPFILSPTTEAGEGIRQLRRRRRPGCPIRDGSGRAGRGERPPPDSVGNSGGINGPGRSGPTICID
jgi:hypothetical protein